MDKTEFQDVRTIELRRQERRLSRRDQVASRRIVGILKDMLLSWRRLADSK